MTTVQDVADQLGGDRSSDPDDAYQWQSVDPDRAYDEFMDDLLLELAEIAGTDLRKEWDKETEDNHE
jgi:hypothetical protein